MEIQDHIVLLFNDACSSGVIRWTMCCTLFLHIHFFLESNELYVVQQINNTRRHGLSHAKQQNQNLQILTSLEQHLMLNILGLNNFLLEHLQQLIKTHFIASLHLETL